MLNGFQEKCLWLDTIICMANLPLRFTAFHMRTLCLYVRSCYLHKYCCHVCIHTQTPSFPNSCFSSPPSQVCTSPASSSSYSFMFVCGGGGKTGSSIALSFTISCPVSRRKDSSDHRFVTIMTSFLHVVLQQ